MSRLNFDPCGLYRLTSCTQPYINHGRTSLVRSPTSPFSPNTRLRTAADTEQCILVILTAFYVTAKIIHLLYVSQKSSVKLSHVSSVYVSPKTKLHCQSIWLPRSVASAENAVYRRHYTGCVYNGMGSWMLVDDAGNSSTVFKTRNGQLQEVLAMMGDNAGCPTFCAATIGPSVKHQQQMFA